MKCQTNCAVSGNASGRRLAQRATWQSHALFSYPQNARTVIGTLQQKLSCLYDRAVPLPFPHPARKRRVIWAPIVMRW
jgi:hypothetical protein